MSDQGPFGQPPQAPPPGPPAPPAGFEQPAAPPPAAYQQPTAPASQPVAPPKKRRNILVIAGVLIAVLFCIPALCIGGFAISAAREEARTREAVSVAEEHYNAATEALEQASAAMSGFGQGGSTAKADEASAKIRSARDELAVARATVEPLDDSEGKTAYLASLDAATKSVEGIEQLIATLKVLTQVSDQMNRGASAIRGADAMLDAAIEAGNDGSYAKMQSNARSASQRYATALTTFTAADKLEPAAGLKSVVDYVRMRKSQADLAVRMGGLGKDGKVSEYNKLVKQQQSLDKKAEALGEPAIISDPKWFENRIAEQQAEFEQAGADADRYRATALKEFGLTE